MKTTFTIEFDRRYDKNSPALSTISLMSAGGGTLTCVGTSVQNTESPVRHFLLSTIASSILKPYRLSTSDDRIIYCSSASGYPAAALSISQAMSTNFGQKDIAARTLMLRLNGILSFSEDAMTCVAWDTVVVSNAPIFAISALPATVTAQFVKSSFGFSIVDLSLLLGDLTLLDV